MTEKTKFCESCPFAGEVTGECDVYGNVYANYGVFVWWEDQRGKRTPAALLGINSRSFGDKEVAALAEVAVEQVAACEGPVERKGLLGTTAVCGVFHTKRGQLPRVKVRFGENGTYFS